MIVNFVILRSAQRSYINRMAEATPANMSEQEQSPGASLGPGVRSWERNSKAAYTKPGAPRSLQAHVLRDLVIYVLCR